MTHSGSRRSTAALNALCPLVLYAVVRDQWSLLAADSWVSQREVVPSWMVGQPGTEQTLAILALVYAGYRYTPDRGPVLGVLGLEIFGVLPFLVVLCKESGCAEG